MSFFIRVLFPSWRFFEDLQWVPRLWFREVQGDRVGEWQACYPPEPRSVFNLFLNPRGNLRLAAQTLVEQMASDAMDLPPGRESSFSSSVSYRLVLRLVQYRIRELGIPASDTDIQFRVTAEVPGQVSPNGLGEEILTSEVHGVRDEL
jgi:hypothetical protein